MDTPSAELLKNYRQGDQLAADELFRRYVGRLTVLARSRLASRIARRVDPEDIVLSAYRSFFVRARDGKFSLAESGDLWRLLVQITLNKLHRTVAHHQAARRSVRRENGLDPLDDGVSSTRVPQSRPSATEAVALAELVEQFLSELRPFERHAVELRLQGYTLDEIAHATGRHERTVRRTLGQLEERLTRRLSADVGEEPSKKRGRSPRAHERSKKEGGRIPPNPVAAAVVPPPPLLAPRPPTPAVWWPESDFVLQAHLGTGGMGRVYRAWQKSLQRTVAIKVLRRAFRDDALAIERLQIEGATLGRLAHPAIVQTLGAGRFEKAGFFLVVEFVPGCDLARIAAERPILWHEAADWVAQAAEALEYAHTQGIVHCDLKPSNLLVDADGGIRITDFGLALNLGGDRDHGRRLAGTPGFMAPEQLDSDWGSIAPASDIFGLGAVLFALLTGRPPFQSKSFAGQLQATLAGAPPEFSPTETAAIPCEIAAVCRRCLAPVPADRYPSAAEVSHVLRGIVSATVPAPK